MSSDDLTARARYYLDALGREPTSIENGITFDLVRDMADEIERLLAAQDVKPRCRTESPYSRFWECERPVGHDGPHIAPIDHVEWEQETSDG